MTEQMIRAVPLFSDLEISRLHDILEFSVIQKYKKNSMIVCEEEAESRFYLIHSGRVKISRITEEGREAVFAFLGEGDFFGEMCIFKDQVSATNVTTTEESQLIHLHRSHLLQIMNDNPQVSINLLKEMTQRLRRRNAQIRSLTMQNATQKVANTLLRFADDLGSINMGQVEISRLPAHRDIAGMVGTSRETISRAIRSLTKKGFLRKERGRLIICDYNNFRTNFC